jgi:hypothetical protein
MDPGAALLFFARTKIQEDHSNRKACPLNMYRALWHYFIKIYILFKNNIIKYQQFKRFYKNNG